MKKLFTTIIQQLFIYYNNLQDTKFTPSRQPVFPLLWHVHKFNKIVRDAITL